MLEELLESLHLDLQQHEVEEERLGDFSGGQDLREPGLPAGRGS